MNLLHDKREQERNHHKDFSELESEPLFSEEKTKPELPPKRRGQKKKRLGMGILGAILLLVVAVVIIYFGFYKPKQTIIDEPGIVSDNLQTEQADQQEPARKVLREQEQPTGSELSSIAMAATILQRVQQNLEGGDQLGTLVLDEGSFSAEITSNSVDNAMAVYDRLIQSLPSEISITSTQPTAGRNVLISGTFPVPESAPSQTEKNNLRSVVDTIADQHAVTVTSFTMDEQAGGRAFIFLKINASISRCQQFLQTMSQQVSGIQVSKLILMPAGNDDFTCVLRFYI